MKSCEIFRIVLMGKTNSYFQPNRQIPLVFINQLGGHHLYLWTIFIFELTKISYVLKKCDFVIFFYFLLVFL